MNQLLIIAANTFKETIRNKILYNILLVAATAMLLSLSFGDLSIFSRAQVMADFGLATLSLTGLLMAIFIGIGLLGMEISNKTVYGILSKPVPREYFICGKFTGLCGTLIINFLLVSLVFYISIRSLDVPVNPVLLSAVALLLVEMVIITAAAILFSAFTTPTLAAIFTIGFYIAGHLNDLVGVSIDQQKYPFWKSVLLAIHNTLPNLEYFNIRTRVVYDLSIPSSYVPQAVLYGLLYTLLLLLFSIIIFSRKDL